MGVDYATVVYLQNYNMWARPVTFYPTKSQPGVMSYDARGIFGTQDIDILAMDGADISEQRTILDILEREFVILPEQQDRLFIPEDFSNTFGGSGMPAEGWWEVNDVSRNGGGETTLTLRRYVPPKP
jgi:hypothetical protein